MTIGFAAQPLEWDSTEVPVSGVALVSRVGLSTEAVLAQATHRPGSRASDDMMGEFASMPTIPRVFQDYPISYLTLPADYVQVLWRKGIRLLGDVVGASDTLDVDTISELYPALGQLLSLPRDRLLRLRPSLDGSAPRLPVSILAGLLEAQDLSSEIQSLLEGLGERDSQMIRDMWSFKRGARPTLESIGQQHGITRERVRQILRKRELLLSSSGIRLPIGGQVLRILGKAGGALPTPELLHRCREAGVNVDRVSISALPSLGRMGLIEAVFWNDEYKMWLTDSGIDEWVSGGKLARMAEDLGRDVRRQLKSAGAVPITRLAEVGPFGLQHDLWLATHRQTKLLRIGEYAIPSPCSDSKLTRITQKLLSISPALTLTDLHAAFQRVEQLASLPIDVIRAVLTNHPSFAFDGERIVGRHPGKHEALLSPSELLATELCQKGGGAILWTECLDAFEAAGYSLPSVNAVLHGPLFVRSATALYAIRGVEVDPELIRKKKREWLAAREEDVVDAKWEGPDHLITRYRLTRFAMQGVLPVPSALKSVRIRWHATFPDGSTAEVKVSHGFVRPIVGWLSRVNAAVGDIVIGTFYLAEGRIAFEHLAARDGEG